jgi:hypothetical protein
LLLTFAALLDKNTIGQVVFSAEFCKFLLQFRIDASDGCQVSNAGLKLDSSL